MYINETNDSVVAEISLLRQYYEVVEETNIISKTNPEGIITYVNKKFLEISGYTQKELVGKPHNIIRNPTMPASIFSDMYSTIKSKKAWRGVVPNLRKDGGSYTVNISIFPILDANNNIVEYMAIHHDITKSLELKNKTQELHSHNIEQQEIAFKKIKTGIVNHLDDEVSTVLYKPLDVLSGDFYSIYKLENGSVFLYILDGQGHGASPALTVFAISAVLNQLIHKMDKIEELIKELAPSIKMFLGEIEQLSYAMVMISADKKNISYSSGGMYPFLIANGDAIIKIKSNNNPLMNFSNAPIVSNIEMDNWDSLMLYSDGLVEHEVPALETYNPARLLKEPEIINELSSFTFEDDVTMIHLKNM